MLRLDQWQKEFLETKGDKILNTGRQVGKSTVCSIDCGEWAFSNSNKTILMIAPTERQAFALFEKTLNYLLTNHLQSVCTGLKRPTQTKIQLTNGTTIWCLPVGMSGLGIRFLTIDRLYGEEASRIENDVWDAVLPMMLVTGGDTILLSTPAGRQGFFYDCWSNKNNAFNSFKRFCVTSEEVIKMRVFSESWTEVQKNKALEKLEIDKARMTKLAYAQEYEALFLDEIRAFFPTELIRSAMVLDKVHSSFSLINNYDTFLGIDVGGMGSDPSVLTSMQLQKDLFVQLDMETLERTYLTETAVKVINKNEKFKYKKIYIDDNGLGTGLFHILLDNSKTKRKIVPINNAFKSLDADDERKRKILKEDLYNNLLWLLENHKVHLFNDPEVFDSLNSVQAEYTDGRLTIFGTNTHFTESLVRACWGIKDKSLNIWVGYTNHGV